MRAERGGSRTLVRSFVLSNNIQHTNKENSGLGPISRPYIANPRGRRPRTIVTNVAGVVLRRHRARTPRPQQPVAHHNEQMAAPNPELERPAQRRITLPRHLSRPTYHPIDTGVIAAIDPLLKDIPLNYIQHTLEEIGPRLLQVTSRATATLPEGQLPRTIQIVCNDISIEPPSHVLAVYTNSNAPRCGVTLFPTHALVLATNCAHIPDLPSSKPQLPAETGGTVTLPVIPLRVPSPATFPTLLSYLYTKRSDHLLTELLPPTDSDTASMDQLATKHAEKLSVKALVDYARTVHGLWSNASALGIFDDKLFRTMEMAWEVIMSALSVGSGATFMADMEE